VISWEQHRLTIPGPPVTSEWLFPTSLLRAHQSIGHVTPSCFTRIFKEWVRGLEAISGDVLGPDGYPLPFDRRLIFPYTLRHSYAQRHADAGVPVDVLRDLMDHVSVQTTMGYYNSRSTNCGPFTGPPTLRGVEPFSTAVDQLFDDRRLVEFCCDDS
jgi:integrase